jgi:hypothetical protein
MERRFFMSTTASVKRLFAPIGRAARANLIPGLFLQAFVVTILISYFESETVRDWLNRVGNLKRDFGYLYSAVATMLFGGLIPFAVLLLFRRVPKGRAHLELAFYLGFWCWKGMEVDAFYRLQGVIFGTGREFGIIAPKVLVDQFVYNLLWAGPTQTFFFLWKDSGFSFNEVKQRLKMKPLLTRILTVLVSTWVVWIPAVSVIYSLPAPLQLPLFNFVLCFFCLLLTFVSKDADSGPG